LLDGGHIPGAVASLVDLLRYRARNQADERAFAFLSDRGVEEAQITFGELSRAAHALAASLLRRAGTGDRAILLFPQGLDFVVAFLGCMVAGLVPVPLMIPRRVSLRDSSRAITADCAPRLVLTTQAVATTRPDMIERFKAADCEWMFLPIVEDGGLADVPGLGAEDIAYLQYTSGSTSNPKGVMVSHRNILENSEMMRIALGTTQASTFVSWVPHYHDLGLILNILHPLYVGSLCVLMAPVSFMERPLGWLRAIHTYRAEVTTAPNFAFDLCVQRFRPDPMRGLDLSCWKVALNAAEPVRADTLQRFAATFAPYGFDANALYPAYGLAEATLLVTASRRGDGAVIRESSRAALQKGEVAAPATPEDAQTWVGCGTALKDVRMAIVDPDTFRRLGPDRVGEVWVNAPSVTQGYWQNPGATAATFAARIAGEGPDAWMRTGDLGFVANSGELFITGRIKDLIIIRGMNHYPQDIEDTVYAVDPALRPNCGAAFTVADAEGREKFIVVQEVERTYRHQVAVSELVDSIREAVVNEHEINPDEIFLLRPGTLPKTTSGKVQRNLTRALWHDGLLDVLEP
jgi:acyl-CoA synthetase (AMP-forming)/AMP-acid ligase II